MEVYWWWTIAGLALVIAELLSGTFYLLVLGLAAFAAAGIAFMGYSFWVQALVAAAISVIGVAVVTRVRRSQSAAPAPSLDVGQTVVLDTWVSRQDRLARVRYRNAIWDAKVIDEPAAEAGQTLYIRHVDGSTLHVSTAHPA